jgi:hypothetical protein
MKNVLHEIKSIIGDNKSKIQIGVVTAKNRDGGYVVENSKGVSQIVSGNADIGNSVLYDENEIKMKIQSETIKRYYIK